MDLGRKSNTERLTFSTKNKHSYLGFHFKIFGNIVKDGESNGNVQKIFFPPEVIIVSYMIRGAKKSLGR